MARQDEQVLLEFHQIGAVVKVSAVDPVTLTEVMHQRAGERRRGGARPGRDPQAALRARAPQIRARSLDRSRRNHGRAPGRGLFPCRHPPCAL